MFVSSLRVVNINGKLSLSLSLSYFFLVFFRRSPRRDATSVFLRNIPKTRSFVRSFVRSFYHSFLHSNLLWYNIDRICLKAKKRFHLDLGTKSKRISMSSRIRDILVY